MLQFAGGVSIRVKIIVAFLAGLACTVTVGLLAVQRLDAVNVAAADVTENQLPSVRLIGDIAYQTMRARQLEATLLLAPDDAARNEEAALAENALADAS